MTENMNGPQMSREDNWHCECGEFHHAELEHLREWCETLRSLLGGDAERLLVACAQEYEDGAHVMAGSDYLAGMRRARLARAKELSDLAAKLRVASRLPSPAPEMSPKASSFAPVASPGKRATSAAPNTVQIIGALTWAANETDDESNAEVFRWLRAEIVGLLPDRGQLDGAGR